MNAETAAPLVRRIRRPDWPEEREVVLVGTAHISPDSLRLVRETIEQEQPDGVCIELDDARYEALMDPAAIERLDLKQVVRDREAVAAPRQRGARRLAGADGPPALGVEPGAELREAAKNPPTRWERRFIWWTVRCGSLCFGSGGGPASGRRSS